MTEYVYVGTNPDYQKMGLLRVGYTNDLERRQREHSKKSPLLLFFYEYAMEVSKGRMTEVKRKARTLLKTSGKHHSKEWYRCSAEEAAAVIQRVAGNALVREHFFKMDRGKVDQIRCHQELAAKQQLEQYEAEKKRRAMESEIRAWYERAIAEYRKSHPYWHYLLGSSVLVAIGIGVFFPKATVGALWLFSPLLGALIGGFLQEYFQKTPLEELQQRRDVELENVRLSKKSILPQLQAEVPEKSSSTGWWLSATGRRIASLSILVVYFCVFLFLSSVTIADYGRYQLPRPHGYSETNISKRTPATYPATPKTLAGVVPFVKSDAPSVLRNDTMTTGARAMPNPIHVLDAVVSHIHSTKENLPPADEAALDGYTLAVTNEFGTRIFINNKIVESSIYDPSTDELLTGDTYSVADVRNITSRQNIKDSKIAVKCSTLSELIDVSSRDGHIVAMAHYPSTEWKITQRSICETICKIAQNSHAEEPNYHPQGVPIAQISDRSAPILKTNISGRTSTDENDTPSSLIHAPGNAATWKNIDNGSSVSVDVDTDTIVRNGSQVKVWERWTYSTVQNKPYYFNNRKAHTVWDCTTHTYVVQTAISYLNEQVVYTQTRASAPTAVVPETKGDAIFKFVCKN